MLSFTETVSKILIGLVLFSLCTACPVLAVPAGSLGKGVVSAASLNMRLGPDRNQRIVQILHRGNEVDIFSLHDGWMKIGYEGEVGYVRNRERYIRIVHSPKPVQKTDGSMADIRQQGQKVARALEEHREKVQDFTEKEASTINSLNDLDQSLNRINEQAHHIRKELKRIEAATQKITAESKELLKEIQVTEEYIAKRIAALYKLNRIGPMNILASADSVYAFIFRKFAMERILEYDDIVLSRHKANKAKLAGVLEELDDKKKEAVLLETDLKQQDLVLSRQRSRKQKLLSEIRNRMGLELAAIDSLKQAAQALDQTILSLHVEPKGKNPKPVGGFYRLKGQLDMPVDGKIISFFGPYKKGRYKVVTFRSGIEIQADRGEPIRAVQSGIVLYSGWFKSYGNMMIIDHGEHYYTLYAHAEELFKQKGDYVEAGEVIATVGDTASMTGTNLYFEVRHRGEPKNPLSWLRDR